MMIQTGSMGHVFDHVLRQRRLAAAMVTAAILASPAAAQYVSGFEPPTHTGSAAGVDLVGQDGWIVIGAQPFRVYTATSGPLGFPPSPAGGDQFIAVSPAAGQQAYVRRTVDFTGPDVRDITADFCCRFAGTPPAPYANTAALQAPGAFRWFTAWDNPADPTSFSIWYEVRDSEGVPDLLLADPLCVGLLPDHWYRLRTRVDFATRRVLQLELQDLTAGGAPVTMEPDWFTQGTTGRPPWINLISGGTTTVGDAAAFDNVSTGIPPPPANILAFGLNHEPRNGATLEFDLDGNLIVNSGTGPGAGEEDVSVHIGDGAGLSYSISPDDNLAELGQEVTCTVRGTVNEVAGVVIARSRITGTGTSALLTVDFPLAASAGQRARLYDGQNRLIASVIVPNASAFNLTSPLRATISSTRSNSKGGLSIDGGGELVQPEHIEEFSGDLTVTHAALPGGTFSKVRKIGIQSAAKQGEPIRNVDVNLGKRPPRAAAFTIIQEGPDLVVPGSPKGLAAFATTGQATMTAIPGAGAVLLEEPAGGEPGIFSIADRGMPGEPRRGKKRATVEMEPLITGGLDEFAYLKTTSHLLVKGKLCPPECYSVSVTETKVSGPLPVEITADFTSLGSTTHRVTVLSEGVVIGMHTGVGPVIGYAEDITNAKEISPADPITRGPGDPVKGISIGLVKKPTGSAMATQVGGTTYIADEIRIEPELPVETIEAIDDVTLITGGLDDLGLTVTSASFEDAPLLVGGLPVSAAGPEAVIDIDTRGQLAVTGMGGTGEDGYTVDLEPAGASGYTSLVPALPAGGTSEGRYDLDITTGTVSMVVAPGPGGTGDDLSFEPITPQGTYDLRAYKKGLKIYSDDDRTGVAVVLVGGTRPVEMRQFIEEIEGTMYVVMAVGIRDGTGVLLIDGSPVVADEVQILTAVDSGAAVRKLDYRLVTDRLDAEHRTDHALLGPPPGLFPIAGLGEAKLERIGGVLTATGLTGSGQDGLILKAIREKGVQFYDVEWQSPDAGALADSSILTTGSFASSSDPGTTFPAKKRDRKREDGRFDVTADFTALGSSTVRVAVVSHGVLVAELPGHSPDIGVAQTAPIGAGAGTWEATWSTSGISSTYPPGTEFVIGGQTYTGDQLIVGAEGRAATDLLMSLSVTTVGYERIVLGAFSSVPLPVCLADLNEDTFVDFADYLEFLNLFDAQSPYVDFNQDGLVDFSDYLEFLNLYDAEC